MAARTLTTVLLIGALMGVRAAPRGPEGTPRPARPRSWSHPFHAGDDDRAARDADALVPALLRRRRPECADSRVRLGWHFRYATDAGLRLGLTVAGYVVARHLRPECRHLERCA